LAQHKVGMDTPHEDISHRSRNARLNRRRWATGAPRLTQSSGYHPCNHAFVAKLDPSGTQVIYNTVLAGTSEDRGYSIAMDTLGNVDVPGTTFSADFPVTSNSCGSKSKGPNRMRATQSSIEQPDF